MDVAVLLVVITGLVAVLAQLFHLERKSMGQTEDLKTAVAQLGVDFTEALARVEAKVAELGEPDPDLSADIAKLKEISVGLDALVAAPVVPEPEPDPA